MQVNGGKWAFEGTGCSTAGISRLGDLDPLLSYLLQDWLAIGAINPSAIQRSIA